MTIRVLKLSVCALFFALIPVAADDPEVFRIGMVDSLIKDLSQGKKELLDTDFPDLVKEFTAFKSELSKGGNSFDAAKSLAAGKWQLGVMPGVAFAWIHGDNPKLKPLLVAINREPVLQALLVVRDDSAIKAFSDLKGKEVAVLKACEHCRLFADKSAQGDAKKFFGKVHGSAGVEDTLDNIWRGKLTAAIVDNAAMSRYKDLQPFRFEKLKIVAKSEPFPATVIVYHEGGLSEAALKKFREGMLKANDTRRGRNAMAYVNVTAFQAVPADYEEQLRSIAKAYPAGKK
ncbi:MAG: PhnD/SsuA/transferrin family substrate-binding protein [Planctomycetes bacterium]|nr:PhnD/SsuA/transferrin family substrate-binding protein [Planctomycetota bacterium]